MDTSRREEVATSTKGYLEQMSLEETDSRELISSSESSDEEDASHGKSVRKKSTKKRVPPKWWFQHAEVKNNWLVVLGAWFLVCLSIVSLDIFRGFILMIIGVVVFLPSGYAVTHVYLAARSVGRIRMDSVWFFR